MALSLPWNNSPSSSNNSEKIGGFHKELIELTRIFSLCSPQIPLNLSQFPLADILEGIYHTQNGKEFFFGEDVVTISVLMGRSALMKRKNYLKSMRQSVKVPEPVSPPDFLLYQHPNTSLTNKFLLKQKKFCDIILYNTFIQLKFFMSKLCDKTLSQAAGGYEAYNRRVLRR